MPIVPLTEMRELVLPGLWKVTGYMPPWSVDSYDKVFAALEEAAEFAPLPAVPLGPKAALALGAAVAVIKNPEMTRRWFFGLWRSQ